MAIRAVQISKLFSPEAERDNAITAVLCTILQSREEGTVRILFRVGCYGCPNQQARLSLTQLLPMATTGVCSVQTV